MKPGGLGERGPGKKGIAHIVVIIVGLLVVAYPFTLGADPEVTCRGEVMSAGDTCAKADRSGTIGEETQTYDERADAAGNAKPVIVGVGVVVTAFGVVLLVGEVRRRRQEPSGSSPIGP